MKRDSDTAENWIGSVDTKNLKKARNFITKIEMLTDLCVHRPNRIIDVEDKKKKKKDDEEENEDNDEFEFLNLSELKQEWDNEDPRVCTDEEVNEDKNQRLLNNLKA